MQTKKTIWQVVDSRTFGGIETHIVELCDGLQCQNELCDVLILKQYDTVCPLQDALKQRNINSQFVKSLCSSQSPISLLYHLLKSEQPKLIHAHGYKASLYCKLLGKLTNTPVIVTYHAGETPSGKVRFYDFLDRYSACLANHNFVVSHQIANKVPCKTQLLKNFIALPSPCTTKAKTIGFVGRLSHEKGPDIFIQIAASFPKTEFILFGDGPMRDKLERQATDNVIFAGFQDMSLQWQKMDILLMPSRFEGLPMTTLEAMARGIPVIATQVGALDQVIDSGTNGWLCQSENELIKALHSWLSFDQRQKMNMESNAISTIREKFSTDVVIPLILKTYNHFDLQN